MRIKCPAQRHNTWCSRVSNYTIWANSADDKKKKKIVICFITKKTGFDISYNGDNLHECKSCFLGRMEKYFKMSSVENFTQNVKRYGLHKQMRMGLCMAKPTIKLVRRDESACTL